jgi:hypothetical protein
VYNNKYAGATDEAKKPKLSKKNPKPGTSILEVPVGLEQIDFMDRLKVHLSKICLEPGDDGEVAMTLGDKVIQLTVRKFNIRQLTMATTFAQAAYFGFRIGKGEGRDG